MGKNAHSEPTPKLPWADVPFFLALARGASLSEAARRLGINRTTMARRLDHLEDRLEAPLFDRQHGKFVLTGFGRRALAAAEHAEEALMQFEDPSSRFSYGRLTVTISEHLYIANAAIFAKFSKEFPEIHLAMVTSDRFLDLRKYEADVAIRLARTPPRGLYTKRMGTVAFRCYRAKSVTGPVRSYLAGPREEVMLPEVQKYLPDAQITMTVDGMIAMRETIAAGEGAGVLSALLGDNDPRLVPVTPVLSLPTQGSGPVVFELYAACMPEQKNLYRIRKFMQFMVKNPPIGPG